MAVIDIARTDVVTAHPETSVADVVRRIHEHSVSGLVITDDGRPLDLVTERDLTVALLDDELDPETRHIEEFIDGDTPTIPAEAGIYETVETLSEEGVRRAILVEDGSLAGLVSISDVVVLLGMELQHVSNAIRSSSPAIERPGSTYYRD